ncbi:unnamed protein product [Commensalibacter communis]|uniref:hypothetical protein n=1 Tax=Commensalibacter communis TaxID=2972786 RepID=UPI0022FF64BA|nr:hypothetical protein [Commensalibacter communis]CAI3959011.1 unnamed protein product [Commensalibacter communis]
MKTYYFDDYGAASNGAFDCTAVWNKIVAEINLASAVIEFGSGTYLFKSNIQLNLNQGQYSNRSQSITIKGQGKGVTNLLWSGGTSSGLSMSHYDGAQSECRYNIHDISFITKDTNTGTAIKLENKNPYRFGGGYLSMRNVAISGQNGQASGSYGWAGCLNLNTISFNNIIDCDFIGNYYPNTNTNSKGVIINSSIGSSNQTLSSIVTNFTDCNFLYLLDGVENGVGTQGLSISQSNFTNCKYGVVVPENGYQISISLSQFDCTDCAVFLSGGTTCFLFSNNLVFTNQKNGYGICCNSYVDGYIITGNQFEGAGTENNVNAIVMNASSPSGMNTNIISSNVFRKYTTGILLASASRGWKVFGNVYALTSNTVYNQGQNNSIKD